MSLQLGEDVKSHEERLNDPRPDLRDREDPVEASIRRLFEDDHVKRAWSPAPQRHQLATYFARLPGDGWYTTFALQDEWTAFRRGFLLGAMCFQNAMGDRIDKVLKR